MILHSEQEAPESLLLASGSEDKKNMPLQLWDRGFDIWVGTFRGNEGTNCNPAKECNDNPLYNWADKGDKDIPALVDKVADLKETGKINVIARTTGASALLYGLATTD